MPIHMIFRDIQNRRNRRMKFHDRFQHERRHLAHGHIARAHLGYRAGIGIADIADDECRPSGVFENLAQQRNGRGLSVRTGHGKQQAV